MAIDPAQYNVIDIRGLSVALSPNGDWAFAIQDPNSGVVNQISVETLGQLIAGNIQLPDGVISGLDLEFNNGTDPKTVSVSAGQWRINNGVYTINVPYVSNVNNPSGTDRTDAIFADNTGVYYQPNFTGTIPTGAILVATFVVPADGSDIEPVTTTPVVYAVMNGLNSGNLNITGQYLVNGIPIGSGGGSAALQFTLTTDINGDIDLSGQTGMPASGTLASAKSAYDGDTDYSQSLTYDPTTQVLSTGVPETLLDITITF